MITLYGLMKFWGGFSETVVLKWRNQAPNTASYTVQAPNEGTWSDQSVNTGTWTEQEPDC